MDHSLKVTQVDHDDILRARTLLLASGRRTPREEVSAYRVLAHVSPAAYLPRLVTALRHLSYDDCYRDLPEQLFALREEAVAAARAIDPAEPARAELLYDALDRYQWHLYDLGRRTEGLAVRAEMLAIDPTSVKGLNRWAAGLSEEGRHAEAADALTEAVAALRPGGPSGGGLTSSLLQWTVALDAAGRSDEALAAFEELVTMQATETADGHSSMAYHLYTLIRHAQMLDTRGRHEEAAATGQEALRLLTELATTGERDSWSGYQASYWAVLLSISGAESERRAPEEPRPPIGAALPLWSREAWRRYVDSRDTLREEVDTLAPLAAEDPDRHLAELVRLHRVLTVRSAGHGEYHAQLPVGRLRPLFDEGVSLARRLSEHDPATGAAALVTALVDRATFRTAAEEFGLALDDLREAYAGAGQG
ncbi:hypothetical protein [Streptomyces sp. NPDC000410]|uniref:hypothetical protein n=1 Tax=Streptomyces sp. NPDC000410 TaxID=3154254 RepID=UPI00332ADEDC